MMKCRLAKDGFEHSATRSNVSFQNLAKKPEETL